MFEVYFVNSYNKRRLIGNCENFYDVNKCITEFLKEKKFKSYYSRISNPKENHLEIDVGSHSEFFDVVGNQKEIDDILLTLK